MILLAVSTSSPRGTVAVARGDTILSRIAYDGGTSHAERLFAAIDGALAAAGLTKGDLQAVACDVGPGSFTGVRVGVAACQGIALGLGLPAASVGSLEAMARAARDEGAGPRVLAVLDAKKEEVFAAAYDAAGAQLWGPEHLPSSRASELEALSRRLGADVVGEMAARLGLPVARRSDAIDGPDAVSVARVAALRLRDASPELTDPGALDPHYVRPPDAKPLAEQGPQAPAARPDAASGQGE